MKRRVLSRLGLLCVASLVVQRVNAGSAVAIAPHNRLVYSWGHPEEEARREALELCRRRYGADARILASSDVTGYCAIAVARLGVGWVIGVALGHRSATESEYLAKKQCLKAGGTNPVVTWGWYG
jgi:Domain of unknown function (DUF4189)